MLHLNSLRLVAKHRRPFVFNLASSSYSHSSPSEAPSQASSDLADAVNAISKRRNVKKSFQALGRASRFVMRLPNATAAAHTTSSTTTTGLFGIEELRNGPEGFARLQTDAANRVASLLNEALGGDAGTRLMVGILDDMSDTVCRVADMADCVRQLHPLGDYRLAAEEACVAMATLVESLNTNRQLYEALVANVAGSSATADEVDRRVGELLIWDFLQSGVHLDAGSREADRFVAASRRAFLLGAEFSRNAMRPAHAAGRLSAPLMDAAGQHPDGDVRRAAYAAFYAEMPDQEATLCQLLATRLEIAQLAGFKSYADRATAGCLLDSSDAVEAFLTGLADRLEPSAAKDAVAMRRYLGNDGVARSMVGAWDFVHLVNVATAACFQGDPGAQSIEQFFSIGSCLAGLAHVAERLFNVQLHLVKSPVDGELWDDRVFKLNVARGCHGNSGIIGSIYCDFFPRAGKPQQDCHFTIRGGRSGPNPPKQLPIVCLQLQCSDPVDSAPSLLSLGQVENLFHEFGHALHSVLGCTRYQHVTGTRCSTDLAEVPSTLLEMFAFQPAVLRHYARHWRTNEPLPERLYAPLLASRRVLPGVSRQQQVLYSMLDCSLHSAIPPPPPPSTTSIFNQLASRPSLRHLPVTMPGTAWQHRFTHLVGYGAKYHSYLVSKAIASLVWSTKFAKDPLCSSAGRDYERTLLARGGERSTAAMVEELTGQGASVDRLVDALAGNDEV